MFAGIHCAYGLYLTVSEDGVQYTRSLILKVRQGGKAKSRISHAIHHAPKHGPFGEDIKLISNPYHQDVSGNVLSCVLFELLP